jgi:hypothetical protein
MLGFYNAASRWIEVITRSPWIWSRASMASSGAATSETAMGPGAATALEERSSRWGLLYPLDSLYRGL